MVLTAADAEEVFRLAGEKNLFCMEAMWSRFLPQYQRAKQWIEEGRIGSIQSANVVVGFKATVDPGHRLINPDLAGGAMYDIGVYAIEPLAYLVGEPIEDCLGVWRKHPVTGVDERATVILQFHSCDAAIQCMFTANPKEYVIINGTEGIIELPFVSGGHDAYLYDVRRNLVEHFRDEWPHSFQFELEEVIRCIREGRITSEIMPPEATIQCARVYDKILRG
jgi:predicted dehydrogenase